MALKLNATREAYQEFYGRNTEQMPKLIDDGRVPMSVAGLIQKRFRLFVNIISMELDLRTQFLD